MTSTLILLLLDGNKGFVVFKDVFDNDWDVFGCNMKKWYHEIYGGIVLVSEIMENFKKGMQWLVEDKVRIARFIILLILVNGG